MSHKPTRGRPRISNERSSPFTTRLPESVHDRLIQMAKDNKQDPAAFVRDVLTRAANRRRTHVSA